MTSRRTIATAFGRTNTRQPRKMASGCCADPTGGGCAITSRELNERVGGFREDPKRVFWLEDEAYIADIARLGYGAAVLADLKVHHTGGPYYSAIPEEKAEFWSAYAKKYERRATIKRILIRVPFVRRLNARYGWFVAPAGEAHPTEPAAPSITGSSRPSELT